MLSAEYPPIMAYIGDHICTKKTSGVKERGKHKNYIYRHTHTHTCKNAFMKSFPCSVNSENSE
jgi:replication-associated recombination protein RarA